MRIVGSNKNSMFNKRQATSEGSAIHANILDLQKYLYEQDKFIEDIKQALQQLKQQLASPQTASALAELQHSIAQLQNMLSAPQLQSNRQSAQNMLVEYQTLSKLL